MTGIANRLRRAWTNLANDLIVTKSVDLSLDRALISFTFDDFPRSAARTGARILEQHGARGTFYASGSLCGQELDGIEYYRAEDLAALNDAGHEIGCHTFAHTRVSRMKQEQIEEDLEKNRRFLTELLPGLRLDDFAFPYGDASPASKMLLQKKFATCRGTRGGLNARRVDLGLLKAVAPGEHQLGRAEIAAAIENVVKEKGWLIFYTHDIDETPSRWGCSPALLDEAVRLARRSDAAIVTVGAALAAIVGRNAA
ncbi:MAG TPA: polysaccharide deacetylase family protein [Bauldia sp.]|nr:polysaccharide deacetylase family protein [Bauldia sp.]